MRYNSFYDYYNYLQRISKYNYPHYTYTQVDSILNSDRPNNQSNIPEIDFNSLYEYAADNDPELIQIIGGNREEFIKTFEVYINNLPQENIDALQFFNKQLDWSNDVLLQVLQNQKKLDQLIEQLKNRPDNSRQDANDKLLEDYQAANNLQYGMTLNRENENNTNLVKAYLQDAKNFTELAALFLSFGIQAIKSAGGAGLLTITSSTVLGSLMIALVALGFGYLVYYLYNVNDKVEKKISDTENKIIQIEEKNIEQENILNQLLKTNIILPAPIISPVPVTPTVPEVPAKPKPPAEPLKVIGSTRVSGHYPSESSFFAYFGFDIDLELYNNGMIQDNLTVHFNNVNNWKQLTITIKLGPIEIKPSDPGYSRVYIPSSFSWEGIHRYDRYSSGDLKNLPRSIKYKDSDLNEGAEIKLVQETLQYTVP